jgi:hypothetical protein
MAQATSQEIGANAPFRHYQILVVGGFCAHYRIPGSGLQKLLVRPAGSAGGHGVLRLRLCFAFAQHKLCSG